jgi:hypothetical protein
MLLKDERLFEIPSLFFLKRLFFSKRPANWTPLIGKR